MKVIILLSLLCFGCAAGRIVCSPTSCIVEGMAVGRARLHATREPARFIEQPIAETPKVAIQVIGCPGNYDYFHECIDDKEVPDARPEEKHTGNVAKIEEAYIEISGGSPSTGFWSTAFDFLAVVATIMISKFGF